MKFLLIAFVATGLLAGTALANNNTAAAGDQGLNSSTPSQFSPAQPRVLSPGRSDTVPASDYGLAFWWHHKDGGQPRTPPAVPEAASVLAAVSLLALPLGTAVVRNRKRARQA
jgi:hypothetical protein